MLCVEGWSLRKWNNMWGKQGLSSVPGLNGSYLFAVIFYKMWFCWKDVCLWVAYCSRKHNTVEMNLCIQSDIFLYSSCIHVEILFGTVRNCLTIVLETSKLFFDKACSMTGFSPLLFFTEHVSYQSYFLVLTTLRCFLGQPLERALEQTSALIK